MGFLTPKPSSEDEKLPGAGLHLDTEPHRCPSCRRETAPWESRCRDCDEVPIPASQLPSAHLDLPPGLQALSDDLDAELAAEGHRSDDDGDDDDDDGDDGERP